MKPTRATDATQLMRWAILVTTLFVAACSSSSTRPDGAASPDGPTGIDGARLDAPARDVMTSCSFGSPKEHTWIEVAAATYAIGSPVDEPCRDDDEAQREVTLSRGFAIAARETTRARFAALMGYDPSFHTGCDDCPVESVSWHEAANYCNALSTSDGKEACYRCDGCGEHTRCELVGEPAACGGYRLPTEAEWEIAARAGTTTPFYGGPVTSEETLCMGRDDSLDSIGWYKVTSTGVSHEVAQKSPNAWGLYDMAGNVYEWVGDWYAADVPSVASDPSGPATGSERVFRGGSWYHNANHARSAARERFRPDKRFNFVGFRCVRGGE